MTSPYTAADFPHSPMLVFYEVTRACDLVCQHCRACAQPSAHPGELTTRQSKSLIDELATFPKPPLLVLTGGDPLKRGDILDLVHHAVAAGLETAMTPSATPLVTPAAIAALRAAGLRRFAVSLDGADAATHDGFRGVAGSFERTLWIIAEARQAGLPVQVNTTVTRGNVSQIDAMAELLAGQGIVLWSVFFLIPVGRGLRGERLSADECETVFEKLWQHAQRQPYAIKTTEAPHYRRFVMQRGGNPRYAPAGIRPEQMQRAPVGTNDGRGVMFVSHTGQVFPSGFMPITCGRFPADSVVDVYQNSATFLALRDPDQLKGKCGVCSYRHACGGSRARAYALTRDPLAAEPDCAYVPAEWASAPQESQAAPAAR